MSYPRRVRGTRLVFTNNYLTTSLIALLLAGSTGAATKHPVRTARKAAAAPRRVAVPPAECAAGERSVDKVALDLMDLRGAIAAERVTLALLRIPGVSTAIVDGNTGLAVVDFDPRKAELGKFLLACKDVGFDAAEYRVERRFPKPIKLKSG